MDYAMHRFDAMATVLRTAATWRRAELAEIVFDNTKGLVQTGPFAGMSLERSATWGASDLATKWLGIYEQELHAPLDVARARTYGAAINVGCAEGYYAVGLARLMAGIPVYACDSSEPARRVTAANAQANGVGARVMVGGHCSAAQLADLAGHHRAMLCVIDCEGFELDLLPETPTVAALLHSDLLIECHERTHPGCTDTLKARFAASHDVLDIRQGGRDPNAFPFLRRLPDLERWILVEEGRGICMNWLWCSARARLAVGAD